MNILDPAIEYVNKTQLQKIELIGKVCTKQEHTIKFDSAEAFVRNRMIDGHTAILMHEYVYFDVHNISTEQLRDILMLSPYIRVSYDTEAIGFCYRVFLDIMADSRRMKARMNLLNDASFVSDAFYIMLVNTPEFASLLYSGSDLMEKINGGETNPYINKLVRIPAETIRKDYPEIYNITYKITTDRGVTHEAVRHTEMSFMQESTRWCNYTKERFGNSINFITPDFSFIEDEDKRRNVEQLIWDNLTQVEADYQELTKEYDIPAQLSRCILPNATKADIYISGTLDMWIGEHLETIYPKLTIVENKGFLPLRDEKHAHPQMKEVAAMIRKDIETRFSEEIKTLIENSMLC